jgi:hypothetical protein
LAGSLEFYLLDPLRTIPPNGLATVTNQLSDSERNRFFAIAHDGTTDGCYCLNRLGADETVYWHGWEIGETALDHSGSAQWIENSPKELFRPNVYAGYKQIRDIAGVRRIVKERAGFEVQLLHDDRELVRPPGEEKDFLPRYHRTVYGVRKLQDSSLRQLSFKVHGAGSPVGIDKVAYVTIDLPNFPVGEQIRVGAFYVRPFNRPFKEIVEHYSPEVDVHSASRVHFAEWKEYL